MKFVPDMFPDFNEPAQCNTVVVRLFAEDGITLEKCHIIRTIDGEFKACSKFYGENPIYTRVETIEEAVKAMEKIWSENHEKITNAFDTAGQHLGCGPWTEQAFCPKGQTFHPAPQALQRNTE